MKHDKPHKLSFACLDCVKKHMEHKEKMIYFLKEIAGDMNDCVSPNYQKRAIQLLAEIKADED